MRTRPTLAIPKQMAVFVGPQLQLKASLAESRRTERERYHNRESVRALIINFLWVGQNF